MRNGKKTFVKISNQDIFLELKDMKKILYETIENNELEHKDMKNNIQNFCQGTDRRLDEGNKAISKEIESLKFGIQACIAITVSLIIGLILKFIVIK